MKFTKWSNREMRGRGPVTVEEWEREEGCGQRRKHKEEGMPDFKKLTCVFVVYVCRESVSSLVVSLHLDVSFTVFIRA
jgi:hypothetical protein